MRVLKVESSAPTASFRYPRVQVGQLPTFDMPPPATIYGQLASVAGEWFAPRDLEFSYVFRHAGKAEDVETIHPIERGSGKPSPPLKKKGWPHPVNVQCDTNIQRREFLLKPELTLYLRSGDDQLLERFREAFLSPHFSYLMGRSQDLATCHGVAYLEVTESEDAFFADTLLPFAWRPFVAPGATVVLPSVIDYEQKRLAEQERYLQVTRPALKVCADADDVIARQALPARLCVDPGDHLIYHGRPLARGLQFWPVRGSRGSP